MCTRRDAISRLGVGELYDLCDQPARHVFKEMGFNVEAEAPIMHVVRAYHGAARSLVIEFGYFDLDYRSEFTLTHETTFASRNPNTDRWHFFSGEPAAEAADLREAVQALAPTYLGYTIIRPQINGTVGRSVVHPPQALRDTSAKDSTDVVQIASRIRTTVDEHVELFGVPLTAIGVPFMEQDAALLTCAHVSAWMCHYTAVLRGVVPRRPSAHFHLGEEAANAAARVARRFPSEGLSLSTVAAITRSLDLPSVADTAGQLREARKLSWHDRLALAENVLSAGDDDKRLERVWTAENLTANVCRHLNSGIPAMLLRDDDEHVQVIVGYLRREDLPSGERFDSRYGADVVELIVSDDQAGPFKRVRVDDLVDDISELHPTDVVMMTPLPRGIWMSSRDAERVGASLIADAAEKRLSHVRDLPADNSRPDVLEALASLSARTASPDTLSVRTYTISGSDFKIALADRVRDPDVLSAVGLTQLAKYVWVVEAIDRSARRSDPSQAVVATVVLDASNAHTSDSVGPGPLLVHLPGFIYGQGVTDLAANGEPLTRGEFWTASIERVASGRWTSARETLMSPQAIARRQKGAVSSR